MQNTILYKLSDEQKDKLKELAMKFKWNKSEQEYHEKYARGYEYQEYPYNTSCGCSGSPHCGCEDPYYCPEEQKYCFLEWEEVWDEEKQRVVEIQFDVRDRPKPNFKRFYFTFCDKHGENIRFDHKYRTEKRNMTRIFNCEPKTKVVFGF